MREQIDGGRKLKRIIGWTIMFMVFPSVFMVTHSAEHGAGFGFFMGVIVNIVLVAFVGFMLLLFWLLFE